MYALMEMLNAKKKDKKLWEAATLLRNSEFKNETVNHVYELITKGEYERA